MYTTSEPQVSGVWDDVRAAWERLKKLQPGKILEREVLPGGTPGTTLPQPAPSGISTTTILIGLAVLFFLTKQGRRSR